MIGWSVGPERVMDVMRWDLLSLVVLLEEVYGPNMIRRL
jgi:hypothetical protein